MVELRLRMCLHANKYIIHLRIADCVTVVIAIVLAFTRTETHSGTRTGRLRVVLTEGDSTQLWH
jgi:hypothetical protein